jgi:hypothetical protein
MCSLDLTSWIFLSLVMFHRRTFDQQPKQIQYIREPSSHLQRRFNQIIGFVRILLSNRENRGCDRMVVGFITTYAISAYHHSCKFETRSGKVFSIQHYMIKFVCDLRQISGFIQVLQFPPPIKLTAMIQLKYYWKWH